MKKRISAFFAIFTVLGVTAYPIKSVNTGRYFNTKFIAHTAQVKQALYQDGFKPVSFISQDGIQLSGLYLQRPYAKYTVICCAGWLPGKKEGMAPVFAMLPKDCNILFFDARGHGESQGDLFGDIWNYGMHEYKDVIGAIYFVRQHTQMPIFIHGWCAGAYHAARAIVALQKSRELPKLNIKGLIFDSGWVSVTKAARTVPAGYLKEIVMKSVAGIGSLPALYLKEFFKEQIGNAQTVTGVIGHTIVDTLFKVNYREFEHNELSIALHSLFSGIIAGFYELFLKGSFEYNEDQTNLLKQVKQVGGMSVPVLFIHSEDDHCVCIDDVKELANHTPRKLCWWIDTPSKHVAHHLKYTDKYAYSMQQFIESTLYQ